MCIRDRSRGRVVFVCFLKVCADRRRSLTRLCSSWQRRRDMKPISVLLVVETTLLLLVSRVDSELMYKRKGRSVGSDSPPCVPSRRALCFACFHFFLHFFSARCNIYIYTTMSASFCLSVTEVNWRIIADLGFKFRSKFTAHCSRGEGSSQQQHLALCYPLLGPLDNDFLETNYLMIYQTEFYKIFKTR